MVHTAAAQTGLRRAEQNGDPLEMGGEPRRRASSGSPRSGRRAQPPAGGPLAVGRCLLSRRRCRRDPRLASPASECCYSRGACATFSASSCLFTAARGLGRCTVRVKGRRRLRCWAALRSPFLTATWHAFLTAGGDALAMACAVRGCGGDGPARPHPRRAAPVRGDVFYGEGPPAFGGCPALAGRRAAVTRMCVEPGAMGWV